MSRPDEASKASEDALERLRLAIKGTGIDMDAGWKLMDLALEYGAAARRHGSAIATEIFAPKVTP